MMKLTKDEEQIIRVALEDLIKNLIPRFSDILYYVPKQRKEIRMWQIKATKLLNRLKEE